MSHQCPGPGPCTETVRDNQLMCKTHWFQVPKPLHDNVWAKYKAEPHSQDHLDAIHAAVESLK